MLTGLLVLLIFLFALLPAALCCLQLRWLDRYGDAYWQSLHGRFPRRFRSVRRSTRVQGIRRQETSVPEFRYVNGVGYFIGDLGCAFNARSPHVRCAVNPLGPCKGCRAYQAKSFDSASIRP